MGIDSSLAIAGSGLSAIERQFSLISQNIANAGTPGYATETAPLSSVSAGGVGEGVVSGAAMRVLDTAVQAQVFSNAGTVAYNTTTANALSSVDQVMGTPGQSNDLGSLMSGVQSAFSTLLADPSNPTQQSAVVSAAQTLTAQINSIAGTIGSVRQTAQNNIASGVTALNTNLARIGTLNTQIVSLKQQGQSTADLENQRDTALSAVAGLASARFITQPDGAVSVFSQSGMQMPTTGGSPFSMQASSTGPQSSYPGGGISGIMLNGQDVTGYLTGGSIGASITLRDQTLPRLQAGIDQISQTMASRFSSQGLTLFSDASGAVPTAADATGFANAITVNPAVAAKPALVRDGTQNIPGSASGASSFTTNPSTGLAGFSTLIERVLNYSFGSDAQSGVPQPTPAPISLNYDNSGAIIAMATNFASAEASGSSNAQAAQTSAQSLQTSLQTQFASSSAVSIDQQMGTLVSLQNAYAANAKVISIANQMWQTVQGMIQ